MKNLQSKLKVLFVSLKWTDAQPGRPLSSTYILINTLQKSGLGSPISFFCDEHVHKHWSQCDEAFLKLCQTSRPDLLFLFPTQMDVTISLENAEKKQQKYFLFPRNETLAWARQKFGIPIINAVGDAYSVQAFKRFESMAAFSDKILLFDPESDFLKLTSKTDKYDVLWFPVPQTLYASNGQKRDIPISFIGRTHPIRDGERLTSENPLHQYAYREQFLQKMIAQGIPVFRAGGAQNIFPLGQEMVARYFQRSKIALNLTYQSPRKRLIRGRSWEALNCGAMLLEEENRSIDHFLEPMKHYVPFTDLNDAVEKTMFYLENESERRKIAEAGYQMARSRYSEFNFWKSCLRLVYS